MTTAKIRLGEEALSKHEYIHELRLEIIFILMFSLSPCVCLRLSQFSSNPLKEPGTLIKMLTYERTRRHAVDYFMSNLYFYNFY